MEWIRIEDGDDRTLVDDIRSTHVDTCHMLNLADGTEWYVADSAETAGAVARERWADMAKYDPTEFACIVGEETLVKWALGELAGPGAMHVRSLAEWLDLVADHPDEELASYDGNEIDTDAASAGLQETLGYFPHVAYRVD